MPARTVRTEQEKQLHTGGYHRKPNDLITVKEAVLLIDNRVSVLLAHWENERREREATARANVWWRRLVRRVRR